MCLKWILKCMEVELNTRSVLHHVTEDIIGIDFINTHHLWYDPVHREVFLTKLKIRQYFC